MSNILTQSTNQTDSEDEITLRQLFAEMQQINELMRIDQADIERLQAENEALKKETQRLKAESRSVLARLEVAV